MATHGRTVPIPMMPTSKAVKVKIQGFTNTPQRTVPAKARQSTHNGFLSQYTQRLNDGQKSVDNAVPIFVSQCAILDDVDGVAGGDCLSEPTILFH